MCMGEGIWSNHTFDRTMAHKGILVVVEGCKKQINSHTEFWFLIIGGSWLANSFGNQLIDIPSLTD